MGQQDGLRTLQMGVPGHRQVAMFFGQLHEDPLKFLNPPAHGGEPLP
jgi:hypothetical protein